MYKNSYYDGRRSRIFLWDQVNGKDNYEVISWSPYVFVPHDQGNYKTLDGLPVIKREFDNFQEYQEFQKNSSNIYENNMDRCIQFLTERYSSVPDEDIDPPNLTIYSIDMECGSGEGGFAKPSDPHQPITLINIRKFGSSNISWGIKNYTGEPIANNTFIHCKSEIDLLQQFFTWWHQNTPDVITGWNIVANNKMNRNGGFDLPYLINRSKVLFGEKNDWYKKLSPISIVNIRSDKETDAMTVDIAGISVIDYLALYKWYTDKNPENYKLDTISLLELKVGKLDYSEYGTLDSLFHKNWNKYVEYNVIDNERIEQLDNKLGFIKLAQSLALLCKCNMESYMSSTALIEGLMATYYRRNGLCAPKFEGGHEGWIPAAYVKEPMKGRFEYGIDLDVTSSYPTAIITLNMSPETYYGRLLEYQDINTGRWFNMMSADRQDVDITEIVKRETPITEFIVKRELPPFKLMRDTGISIIDGEKLDKFNKALKKGLICVAPCGSMFMTNKKGVYAQVCQETFNKRVVVKNLMKVSKIEANKLENGKEKEEWNNKAKNQHALQWAIKIVINSMYGTLGAGYSRYFNLNIAEAITSCGRRAVVNGIKFSNELLNNPELHSGMSKFISNPIKGNDKDYITYSDTDSIFIRCRDFLKDQGITDEIWNGYDQDKQIDMILDLSSVIEDYVNTKSYEYTQLGCYNSQVKKDDFTITFKQELVYKNILFIKKKKYGLWIVNKEGVPCDDIAVTGLDIIRSETPAVFREALREMLGMILRGAPERDILNVYNKHRKVSRSVNIADISENKGVKGLSKWLVNGESIKGTPYHVKAVANYHRMLKILKLENRYQEILDDSKNKLIYVKDNNYGIKCVMYDSEYPVEFEKVGLVPDIETMIEKYLTKKLIMLLEPMGLEHIIQSNQSFGAFFN